MAQGLNLPIALFRKLFGDDDHVSNWDERDVQLLNAIYANNTSVVQQLLQSGANRELGSAKVPLLCLSVRFNQFQMTSLLIDAGCDIRARAPIFWNSFMGEYEGATRD